MSDHYDRLENRPPSARESTLFRDLRHIVGVSRARAAGLRAQVKGFELAKLVSRAELQAIPVQRSAELLKMQAELPPFGGLVATRVAALKQVFLGPSKVVSLQGQAKDWWGAGRALYAAGLRKGILVINCFSYDLVPHGHMIDSGAHAIGAPVIPAGNAAVDLKAEAVHRLKPAFFCGAAQHLKDILDRADDLGLDATSIKVGLVPGPIPHGLRNELSLRGVRITQALLSPEVGVIAFESGTTEGLTVNEGLVVEIVDPVTGKLVTHGDGEVVVSRINADYPLLRFGTGIITAALPQPASCGRTNMRLRLPDPEVEACRNDVAFIREIAKRHPNLGRMRMVFAQSRVHLKVENANGEILERVSESLQLVTCMTGTVEFVEPGALSDDEGPIVEDRSLN